MTRTTAFLSCKFPHLHRENLNANRFDRLFMHGGHTNHLAEFSWNPNEPWLVASAAEDNLLQIWKVADSIVSKDDGELPIDELDR